MRGYITFQVLVEGSFRLETEFYYTVKQRSALLRDYAGITILNEVQRFEILQGAI